MATRIEERAPSQALPTQGFTRDLAKTLLPAEPSTLFRWPGDKPFAESSPQTLFSPRAPHALLLERCVDLTLATLLLLILSPFMLATALVVLLSGRGPAFYRQPRLGLNGETFDCLKFRTMQVDADRLLQGLLESSPALREVWMRDRKLRKDPRITPIGRFLRRYSLDELPQLFNVLCGEMSIVGPRPIATDEAHFYGEAFSIYCSVKPGITGAWQVGGRNDVSYQRRVQLDCEYARTKSLRQDIRLLLRTVPVVLRGTGI